MSEQTLGQRRVRVSFNPSGNPVVDKTKQLFADIIDELQARKLALMAMGPEGETQAAFQLRAGEALRQIAVAQTEAEGAAHWAVKALTAEV